MGMSGTISKEKPNGETATVIFYGDLLTSPDRKMSNARVKAKGQFLIEDSEDELKLRTAAPISSMTKKSIELELDGETKTFKLTRKTTFCDHNGMRLKRKQLEVGNLVTISSKLDEEAASSVRKGPIYFTGAMSGTPKLVDIICVK
jgi:hypothetical protein